MNGKEDVLTVQLLKALKASLLLPKKDAMFRLNRIGMGTTVGYIFILMLIATIPPGIDYALTNHAQITNEISPTVFVLQFFVFYYFIFALLGLIIISLLAAIGTGISWAFHRKLTYRQLWKMSAYATTLPALLFTLAESLKMNYWIIPAVLAILTLVILFRMILIFPRRKH